MKQHKHNVLIGIISVCLMLTLIAYLAVSYYIADIFTRPYVNPVTQSPSLISPNYENISFITTDKVQLSGWIFPGISNKAVILVHGLGQNRLDVNYGTTALTKDLLENGYTVLVFDLRGHGNSAQTRLGYGFLESRDVIAAVNVLESKNFLPQRIGIIGSSMGAVATLHAAPELQSVGAIILDSSAYDMKKVIAEKLVSDKHVPRIVHPGVFFMAEHVFGIPLTDGMPASSLDQTPERAYLFLHGEKDTSIDVENSKQLVTRANMLSSLVIFKNAAHIQTYKSDPVLYRETVFSFLAKHLGN